MYLKVSPLGHEDGYEGVRVGAVVYHIPPDHFFPAVGSGWASACGVCEIEEINN